ncbi:MAG: DEAD/DEAH box helicase [Candidatus Marinimicrobia bacterium]|nr:DEAD/DEAH box helicase [Candidatus Neomarinimicrobiota bacterium]
MKSVFNIHESIVNDYKSYVSSFIQIKNDDIREIVKSEIDLGRLWPEALIRFNPSFEPGESVKELISQNILHPELKNVFSVYNILYRHQVDAVKLGTDNQDFIVTSGTGSGKSLTFIGTIFDYLFKSNTGGKSGIKAVIVYPMNALINSQTEELNSYRDNYEISTGKPFPIKYAQYTGQEKQDVREKIREDLPDIILTNYMMLELILTRIQEKSIRDSIYSSLQYLVFDELHTYRGRQGSDVALLIRRIKAKSKNDINCIGTSATMVSGGTLKEQREKVAEVATTLFGSNFTGQQIINESLAKSIGTDGGIPTKSEIIKSIQSKINKQGTENELNSFPLAVWLENRIALDEKEGILVRNKPISFSEIAKILSDESGIEILRCSEQLSHLLEWITNVNATAERPYLPFKLHQFISQTGSVYITLDYKKITLEAGAYASKDGEKTPLFPIVFSRTSGQEFICVIKNKESNTLHPRDFRERADDNEDLTAGYIIPDFEIWDPVNDIDKLPDAWIKYNAQGQIKVIPKYKDRIPSYISYDENGNYSSENNFDNQGWFMPVKLLFDPSSGTEYDPKTGEGTKLTKLGSEGRSTSTTISTFTILKHLGENGYGYPDQKVLSFTDNRQDAALQAGHFNDFMRVVHIRSGIYKALENKRDHQLDHSTLSHEMFKALNLRQVDFAGSPSEFPGPQRENEEALKHYLTYRALYDLRRGWRVILPNLEQCALLEINYKHLDDNCSLDNQWQSVPYFDQMSIEDRKDIVFQVLDYFRRSYSIFSEEYLTADQIGKKQKIINEKLKPEWKFDENERIQEPYFLYYETIISRSKMYKASIGYGSGLGKYLRSELKRFTDHKIKTDEYIEVISKLLNLMAQAGWLKSFPAQNKDGKESKIYQLLIDAIIWELGNGENIILDRIKNKSYKIVNQIPNNFFQQVYKTDFGKLKKYTGKEHTGQIDNNDRIDREDKFRSGEISALYCSPTMELGIDISSLNVVHMRNVPPNPANYAQRSGRAGRRGQAALVYTYCSNYSPHDRHYFNNATDMVAGVVAPPRIDLSNEELLYTHINALYLAEIGLNELDHSLADLINETNQDNLPLSDKIVEKLKITDKLKNKIIQDFHYVVKDFEDEKLNNNLWYNDEWIERQIDAFTTNIDHALNRWRLLYITAQSQLYRAQKEIESGLYPQSSQEMKNALRDQGQAIRQRDLLKNSQTGWAGQLSEFYPYRYLASEGFLPGYNFTRLPLRTFIPKGNSGEYISRPRFIALREFGPRNVVYHNGTKYRMEQLIVQDAAEKLDKAKISVNSGYYMDKDEFDNEICPFSGVALDSNDSKVIFTNLLEMGETKSEEIERISCEEEERLSQGFNIETYFSVPGGLDSITTGMVQSDGENFLKLQFIPAAKLIQINTKWRTVKENGFPVGLSTGRWKKNNQVEQSEEIRRVQLKTSDTADALYIEPIKALGLEPEGIITLQYALKRAIENLFQIESKELGVTHMGDPKHPNIFLYEAAEGSLGILSQFVEKPRIFSDVIDEAISLLKYDDPEYEEPASYNDLLSYYNQRDHADIDRFLIKDALEKLKVCKIEIQGSEKKNYEEQYQLLLRTIDPNSDTEKKFLKYLYDNNLKLPDSAQKTVDGIYVKPDFYYAPDFWVFCDGTPHDKPSIKEDDGQKRDAIRNAGHQVFVYYYLDDLNEIVSKRPDIFKKVR